MDSQNEQEQELQRKEQELRDREQAIRLRELENEIRQKQETPFHQTKKHDNSEKSLQSWGNKLVKMGKFAGIVVLSSAIVMMAFHLSIWLTRFVIVGIIAFIAYKIIFDSDKRNK